MKKNIIVALVLLSTTAFAQTDPTHILVEGIQKVYEDSLNRLRHERDNYMKLLAASEKRNQEYQKIIAEYNSIIKKLENERSLVRPDSREQFGPVILTPKKTVSPTVKKAKPIRYTSYKVKKGDTLSNIANKCRISIKELKKINNLKSDAISFGNVLKIPL